MAAFIIPRLAGPRLPPLGPLMFPKSKVGIKGLAGKLGAKGMFGKGAGKPGKLLDPRAVAAGGGSKKDIALAESKVTAALLVVEQRLRDEYNKLSVSARRQGAAKLTSMMASATGVNLQLTGDETFEEVSEKVGRAAGEGGGRALGTYLGGPQGGEIGAKLGAMIGSYTGKKVGPALEDAYDSVRDGLSDAADETKGAIKGAAKKSAAVIGDAAGAAKDFIGSLW